MYDIIGDIHGYHSKLCELLAKLGYTKNNGSFSHPTRKAIFVGDYVDRGPEIRETLNLARNMVKECSAIALMGNHEYNALAYHYQLEGGSYLRPHYPKNQEQHRETLRQFEGHEEEWKTFIDWFYELPVFLDLGDLRVVHACWDPEHIDWLIANGHRTMSSEFLVASHRKGSREWLVIEETLKGKEINIPKEFAWLDKDGHLRTENRYKWWRDPHAGHYKEFLFNCPEKMKEEKVPAELKVEVYPASAPPVFFGHYWLEGTPSVQAANVVCQDYSVAKNGSLVAYRWNKGEAISEDNFVWI